MDQDLMDAWLNCAYGVDCDTHRQALSEIQQLRKDLAELEDHLDIAADLAEVTAERDELRAKLDDIRRLAA